MDGPVEQLCSMIDDWQITHDLNDLPADVWKFMRDNKFFAINIPTEYGGLGFSPVANSDIVCKVTSRSGTAGVTVMVPNSLGPGELLLHYGTREQRDFYLPRLASGEEIPCFALTSPVAGSDAGAMPDNGVVCRREVDGEQVLGFELNWNKRYITLAPVATLVGLAFKARDPDHLLGEEEELGITCALIPHDIEGITIGNRHNPLDSSFQNGPIQGVNVFIPFDRVIGGKEYIGKGWRMLMGSLAAGRGISLPATGVTAAKVATRTTGAYARIREQFGISIARFEGVEEALARIGALTYMLDAGRRLTIAGLAIGEQPAVVTAIAKYYLTETARDVINDAMDVHGGRGIMMGPNNYLATSYQQMPIAITVEGANILTRTLIIFGQGAMRCHPYILDEIAAAGLDDEDESLQAFDTLLFAHLGYTTVNAIRAFVDGLSGSLLAKGAGGALDRHYKSLTRFSAAFSFLSDVALLVLGGALKRREKLSGRFADALTHMFMCSAVLKRFRDTGQPAEDLPLVEWACRYNLYQIQQALDGILRNFPVAAVGIVSRILIFPLGRRHELPSDDLGHDVAELITRPGSSRDRLTEGIYKSKDPDDVTGRMDDALEKYVAAEPLLRKLRKDGVRVPEYVSIDQWLAELVETEVLSGDDAQVVLASHEATSNVIQVDDFAPGRQHIEYK
jgi:acyl-CoA dehydrogenase